jgi:hypothetical protein
MVWTNPRITDILKESGECEFHLFCMCNTTGDQLFAMGAIAKFTVTDVTFAEVC